MSRLSWSWRLVLLLAGALLAATLWKGASLLDEPAAARAAWPDPGCRLSETPCEARFAGGGRVRLAIDPPGIPTVTPLRIQVETTGLPPLAAVAVDFVGVEMNMGYNRVRLDAVAPGRHQGTAMLPVCVSRRMTWEARVLLQTAEGWLGAPFRFETVR